MVIFGSAYISTSYSFREMIIPVRCFTCGKVIAHLYDEYVQRVEQNHEDP